MKEITTEALIENIEKVTAFVEKELEARDCPVKTMMQIDVAIDELFSNIAHYAYDEPGGTVTIRIEFSEAPLSASISFTDRGKPFDPLAKEDPDITLSAEERGIGGLGIFMVKKTMDDVIYERRDGQNILTIVKNLNAT